MGIAKRAHPCLRSPQTAFDRVSIHHPPQTSPGQWTIKDSLKCDHLLSGEDGGEGLQNYSPELCCGQAITGVRSSPLFMVRPQRLTEHYIPSEGITVMGFCDSSLTMYLKMDFILPLQMSEHLKPS